MAAFRRGVWISADNYPAALAARRSDCGRRVVARIRKCTTLCFPANLLGWSANQKVLNGELPQCRLSAPSHF